MRFINFILFIVCYIICQFNTYSTGNLVYSTRKMHRAIVFNHKIWIIGGIYGNTTNYNLTYNDLWSSENGTNWIKESNYLFKPARSFFSCVVFKNKLWVIGGYDNINGVYLSDVISTENGSDWEKEALYTTFPGRSNAAVVEFKKKLWLIGGRGEGVDGFKDIWNSTNGIDWYLVSDSLPFQTIFDITAFVHNDEIIVFVPEKGVYSSKDGINWQTLSTDNIITKRIFYSLVKMNEKFYLICGEDFSQRGLYNELLNDVWVSDDGISWTQISPYPGESLNRYLYFSIVPARKGHASLIFKNRLFVIGGISSNKGKGYLNDVWISPAGMRWVKIK